MAIEIKKHHSDLISSNNLQKPDSNSPPTSSFMKRIICCLLIFVKGVITGIAGILPGFSGGVMMLVFGVYEPLMYVFSHPFAGIKKHWKLLFPFGFGLAAGFILSARVLADVFTAFELQATFLFFGLVLGMLPSLFRQAGKNGRTRGSYIALGVSTIIALAFFCLLKLKSGITIIPNTGWYLFCGVLWGLSLIVPGMSSSSTLMLLGLYIPLSEGIGSLNMSVIIPWAIGILITIAALSRLISFIFEKYYAIASHCIIGIVLAATLPLIIQNFGSIGQLFLCIILAVLGFFIALAADKFETHARNSSEKSSIEANNI